MKLKDARRLFNKIRILEDQVVVRRHAWADHPEREFAPLELVRLIAGNGSLRENKYPTAQSGSFLWVCKDDDSRKTEIAIVFELDDSGELIVIIHAYRMVKNEKS